MLNLTQSFTTATFYLNVFSADILLQPSKFSLREAVAFVSRTGCVNVQINHGTLRSGDEMCIHL